MRGTVRFADAVAALAARGVTRFVEIGPDSVLTAMAADSVDGVACIPLQRRDRDQVTAYATGMARAWTTGVDLDWAAVHPGGRPVELPTYAFQHQRYWTEPDPTAGAGTDDADGGFWDAVDRGDTDLLADGLGVAPGVVTEVLPGLAAWRARQRDASTVDDWRYRVVWRSTELPDGGELTGTWWLVVPPASTGDARVTALADGLAARGADVVTVTGTDLPAGDTPAGVLSLLALDDTPDATDAGLSVGVTDTVALIQALTATDFAGRIWCLTAGGVAVDRFEDLPHPAQGALWGLGPCCPWSTRTPGVAWSTCPPTGPVNTSTGSPTSSPPVRRTRWPSVPPACWPGGWSAGPPPAAPNAAGSPPGPCWSPAAPAASARTSPTGCSTTARTGSCWPAGAARPPRARPT